MERRSAIRFAARQNASHPAHIEAVKRLLARLDSRGIPCQVRVAAIETGEIGDSWGREVSRCLDFSRVARAVGAAGPS